MCPFQSYQRILINATGNGRFVWIKNHLKRYYSAFLLVYSTPSATLALQFFCIEWAWAYGYDLVITTIQSKLANLTAHSHFICRSIRPFCCRYFFFSLLAFLLAMLVFWRYWTSTDTFSTYFLLQDFRLFWEHCV